MHLIPKSIGRLFRLIIVITITHMLVAPTNVQADERQVLQIKTATQTYKFYVEIADTEGKRAQGLMHRREMARDHGMLFYYKYDLIMNFWMKNTYIPLDLIFVDRTGRIDGFFENAVPHSLANMTSKRPVRGVIEINAGLVRDLGIKVGDRVIYQPLGWTQRN